MNTIRGLCIFDFDVYAVASDGDMMEGISWEAASLAGHQHLSNLCWIYDSNRVTIEGHTDVAFTEDVAERFLAYDWNVTTLADANNLGQVQRALHTVRAEHVRPTLIVVHSQATSGTADRWKTARKRRSRSWFSRHQRSRVVRR